MRQLVIEGVPAEIRHRLEILALEKQQSLSETVVEILCSALLSEERRLRFARQATWTREEQQEFDVALRELRRLRAPE